MSDVGAGELSSLAILIVEDDADIRRMVSTILEGMGANVSVASNGRDAVASVDRQPFDAVLVDWNLGDMPDGALLPRLAAARPELVPHILVMTGELMRTPAEHAAGKAGYALLTKPFRPAALRKAIVKLVG